MKFTRFLIFISLLLTACVERGKVEVSGLESATPSVTDVNIKDGKLHLKGHALHSAKDIKIDDTSLEIESQSESSLVAYATEALSLTTSAVFDLVISNAQGSSTYPIQLVISDGDVTTAKLADGAVTAGKLDDMGATTGQILKYDGSQWIVSDLGNLTYSGNWDASNNQPDLMVGGNPGEYYIVNVAGTYDLNGGPGTNDWAVGDWVIWNETETRWEKINNASNVTSFAGRSGPVVPESGDYTWDQIDKTTAPIDDLSDVDTSTTTPNSGEVLKWDGSNWAPGTDDDSGGDITEVNAGTGLTGGGTSGSVTLDVDAGTSSNQIPQLDSSGLLLNSIIPELDTSKITSGVMDQARLPYASNTQDGIITQEEHEKINSTDTTLDGGATGEYLDGDGNWYVLDNAAVGLGNVTNDEQIPLSNLDTNTALGTSDTSVPSQNAVKTYVDDSVSTASNDYLLRDGTQAMTGNFDGGGFDLTKIGSLTTNNQAGVTLNPFGTSGGETGELRFMELETNGTNYLGFKAPDNLPANQIWALPDSDGGSGNVLTTDGSGNLSWSSSGDGSVTEVTGTSPISSTGGTTPDISISQAGTTSNGYLSSTDWNTFNDKEPAITSGDTAEYWRGDKTWQTLDTSVVPENGPLYFTDTRAQNAVVEDNITDGTTNRAPSENAVFDALATKEDNLGTGVAGQYLDENKAWQDLNTDAVAEASNLYFTESRVLGSLLSGYTVETDTALGDGDTLLQALGKLEAQIQADASNAFLKDGSVAMTGNFDGGGNNLTNVGSLTTNNQAGATLNPFGTNGGETGELRFMELEANGTNYLGFKAPDALSANQIWRLPGSDGADGEALVTDGSGVLSWAGSLPPSGGAGGELSGSYPDPTIADGVIDSANLMTDSVTSAEIAADAVGTSEIATDGVDSAEIAAGAVNTNELAADSVTSGKIADGEILNADVNASADIAATKLGTGVVDNTEFNYLDGLTGDIQTQLDEKVDLAGDDMTGPLTVPADSFTVGTNQIVTDNGNVGIGTATPDGPLHVETVKDAGANNPGNASFIIGPMTGLHLEVDDNEIAALSDSSTVSQLNLQADGGGVVFNNNLTESEKVYIDGGGNVGVGTMSPAQELHVEHDIQIGGNGNGDLVINDNTNTRTIRLNSSGASYLNGGNFGIGTKSPNQKLEVNGNILAHDKIFYLDDTTDGKYGFGYNTEGGSQATIFTDNVFQITESDNDKVVMHVEGNAGNVGIGTTSPSEALEVNGNMRMTGGGKVELLDWIHFNNSEASYYDGLCTDNSNTYGEGNGIVWWDRKSANGVPGFWMCSQGTVYRMDADTTSTRETKKDIIPLRVDSRDILDLNPVSYKYKHNNHPDIGLIAEEVDKAVPELVLKDERKDFISVDYEKLSVLLLKVTKEQDQEIKDLEEQNSELEGRVDKMERELASIKEMLSSKEQ